MMESDAVYIGTTKIFWQTLSDAALSLKIPCQMLHPDNVNAETQIFDRKILFFDYSDPKKYDLIGRIAAHQPAHTEISILIVNESDHKTLNNNDLCNNRFADVLCCPIETDLLAKKLALYRDCLFARLHPSGDIQYHQLLKKYIHLDNQVISLQQSLTRTDSNLKIHEQVIDKINQISHLSRQINCLDIHRIAAVCIEKILRLIAARFASLYALDSTSHILTLLHHNHPYAIQKQVVLDDSSESPMAVAVRQKKLLVIDDLVRWTMTQKLNLHRPFTQNYHSSSCIVAPLFSGGDITGVLNLADKIDGPAFDASADLAPVQLLSEIIGSAMSNIKLYEAVQKQAQTDGLTGLLNHRTFYLSLAREIQRANRYGASLSLLMIDMDNLKKINDYFGHPVGDSALLHVAATISQCIRETDIASRYGGDEFAVILPNTSLSDALIVANRLVHTIDGCRIAAGDQHIPVTISVGLSPYQPGQSVEDFARHADNALIEAKKSGKNRIHIDPVAASHPA